MFQYEFILENYTKSETADRLCINNSPDPLALRSLLYLHAFLSEIARNVTDVNFNISSAYRNKELNDAIQGAKNSAHMKGVACDITTYKASDLRKLYIEIKNSGLNFDQLILYDTHIHVSIDSRMRRMAFAKVQHVDKDEASELHGY